MKDLGYLWHFLGIEVVYSPKGYLLSQLKYVADILELVKLTDKQTVDTLIKVNARYSSFDGLPLSDPTLYRTIVRSLVYLIISCLDIVYVVNVVSHFVASFTSYQSLGSCSLYFVISLKYSLLESFIIIYLFLGAACLLSY